MPSSVIFVLVIEAGMIFLTTSLIIQSNSSAAVSPPSLIQKLVKWTGVLLLFLTFFWSILVGIVLSMNGLMLKL